MVAKCDLPHALFAALRIMQRKVSVLERQIDVMQSTASPCKISLYDALDFELNAEFYNDKPVNGAENDVLESHSSDVHKGARRQICEENDFNDGIDGQRDLPEPDDGALPCEYVASKNFGDKNFVNDNMLVQSVDDMPLSLGTNCNEQQAFDDKECSGGEEQFSDDSDGLLEELVAEVDKFIITFHAQVSGQTSMSCQSWVDQRDVLTSLLAKIDAGVYEIFPHRQKLQMILDMIVSKLISLGEEAEDTSTFEKKHDIGTEHVDVGDVYLSPSMNSVDLQDSVKYSSWRRPLEDNVQFPLKSPVDPDDCHATAWLSDGLVWTAEERSATLRDATVPLQAVRVSDHDGRDAGNKEVISCELCGRPCCDCKELIGDSDLDDWRFAVEGCGLDTLHECAFTIQMFWKRKIKPKDIAQFLSDQADRHYLELLHGSVSISTSSSREVP